MFEEARRLQGNGDAEERVPLAFDPGDIELKDRLNLKQDERQAGEPSNPVQEARSSEVGQK